MTETNTLADSEDTRASSAGVDVASDSTAEIVAETRLLHYRKWLEPAALTSLAIHLVLMGLIGFDAGISFAPLLASVFGLITIPLSTWALTRRIDRILDNLLGESRGIGGVVRLLGGLAFIFLAVRTSQLVASAPLPLIQRYLEIGTPVLSIAVMTSLAFLGLGAADLIYDTTSRFRFLSTRLMILLTLSSIANFLWLSFVGLQARALIEWAVTKGHLEVYVEGIERLEQVASAYVGGVAGALSLELPFLLLLAWRFGRNATRGLVSLRNGFRRVEHGDLNAPVPVVGNDEVADMQRGFNAMLAAARERQMLEAAFGRYVSPHVLERLRENGDVSLLTPERRVATVLFSDIRGFTKMSANQSPEKVISILNAYLSSMIDCIARYDGYINKFVGDAIMVVWGAPLSQEDHALRAVQCAREMMRVLADANARGGFAGSPLEMGIGINTGPLVAGNLGNAQQVEYTVIGDSVNVASRACSAAAAHQVAVTQAVLDEAKKFLGDANALKTTPLGLVEMKGKGEVELFVVDSVPGEENAEKHRTSSSLLMPIVDIELDPKKTLSS